MSNFELKYLKEVLNNLMIIREDLEYRYTIDDLIETLIKLIKEQGGRL